MKNHFFHHLLKNVNPPATTPAPTVTGTAQVPKTPRPNAPRDCRPANIDPAETAPIPDWTPAATDPATTPPLAKPKAVMTADETPFVTATNPVALRKFFAD